MCRPADSDIIYKHDLRSVLRDCKVALQGIIVVYWYGRVWQEDVVVC